ncbi:unnamed protein product [Diamesa hyperborea]
MYTILIIGLLMFLLYVWIKNCFLYWKKRGFESAVGTFPFGNLSGVGSKRTSAEALMELYEEHKEKNDYLGIYLFITPAILAINPEFIKSVLVRDFTYFHDRGFYHNKRDDPLSANLLTLEGQEWKKIRSKLTPVFTSGKLKMMFDIVSEIGDKLVKVLEPKLTEAGDADMREFLAEFTTDVIGNIAFGLECNSLEDPDSEFRKYGKKVFEMSPTRVLRFFLTSAFPNTSRNLGIKSTNEEPAKFFTDAFIKTVEYREQNNIERNDFLQLLIQQKNSSEGLKETSSLTNLELAAEGFIFYIGGFETSSSLLTFLLYEMALNPDIQDRLRDEIKSALDDNDGKLTYDVLSELKYLDMVINETLRKYPPVFFLTRKSNKDFVIPETKLIIPKGTHINIPVYSLHRDPEYYPDSEKYDPERFTPENIKTRQPFTFMAFGEGPRVCIGLRFGIMQSKIGLVKLLTNYKFTICEKSPVPMKFNPSTPFIAPLNGMFLKLESLKR